MANCISALNELLIEEGGIAVTTAIANTLLLRLQRRDFDEWSQCLVLDLIAKYKPESRVRVGRCCASLPQSVAVLVSRCWCRGVGVTV